MTKPFDKPGHLNTGAALDVLEEGLDRYGIRQVIVASTYGNTGLEAARRLRVRQLNLVVVTHNYGFRESGALEMPPETRRELTTLGARVLTGTMPFRNIGTAIRETRATASRT